MTILVNVLTNRYRLQEYVRFFRWIMNYDPHLSSTMYDLLFLNDFSKWEEKYDINEERWSLSLNENYDKHRSLSLQEMWDYEAMKNSELNADSELKGAGDLKDKTSDQLVWIWWINYMTQTSGVLIQYRKFPYSFDNFWGTHSPPMNKVLRKLHVEVDDKGEQTRVMEETQWRHAPCPVSGPMMKMAVTHNLAVCTEEQRQELRVLGSEKFDLCLQRLMLHRTKDQRFRCRYRFNPSVYILPNESVARAMEVILYEGAFDGDKHIYPDGVMFTHDSEWHVRGALLDINNSKVMWQRVRLNTLLQYDPSFLLSSEFQQCIERYGVKIFGQ